MITGLDLLRSLHSVRPHTFAELADSEERFWKASNCADGMLLDQLGDAELLPAAAIIGRSFERCGISARQALDVFGTDPIDAEALIRVHAAIAPQKCPIGFRNCVLRVTGDQRKSTAFFPPHPKRIGEQVDQLTGFLASHPQGFVRAAIGFGWFEWIHPFRDGNGRVGRVLLRRLLCAPNEPENVQLLPAQPGPIGLTMRHDRMGFNDAHRAMRCGDLDTWLHYFARMANQCADALLTTAHEQAA
jgi:Fic/DOC family